MIYIRNTENEQVLVILNLDSISRYIFCITYIIDLQYNIHPVYIYYVLHTLYYI